jgi:hypothetical protein
MTLIESRDAQSGAWRASISPKGLREPVLRPHLLRHWDYA